MRREDNHLLREWLRTLRAIGVVSVWLATRPACDGVLQVVEDLDVGIVSRAVESQEFAQAVLVVILVGQLQDRLVQFLAEPYQCRTHLLVGPLAVGYEPWMLDAGEVGSCAQVEDDVCIRMSLEEACWQCVSDVSFHYLLHDVSLLVAPSREIYFLGREQGSDTHGERARRNLLLGAEAVLHLLSGCVADEDETGYRLDAGTRFVGSDVTHSSDAQQSHVETTEGLDALLVEAACILHSVLSHAAVEREDILWVDVNMVEEALLQLVDALQRAFLGNRIVLVGVESNHVSETELLSLASFLQFIVDRCERKTCAQCHYIILTLMLGCLDFLLYLVSYVSCTLHGRGEDVGVNFLHSGDF